MRLLCMAAKKKRMLTKLVSWYSSGVSNGRTESRYLAAKKRETYHKSDMMIIHVI